jgi:hypothetical protein
MKWALLSRSLRWVLVVAAAALLAVTWGGGHAARLAAPGAGPGVCSAGSTCMGTWLCVGFCPGGRACLAEHYTGACSCNKMSVGGIAELPQVARAPARASASSDRPYAALAGGLAAGVLALGAGGWYARRRWLKQ